MKNNVNTMNSLSSSSMCSYSSLSLLTWIIDRNTGLTISHSLVRLTTDKSCLILLVDNVLCVRKILIQLKKCAASAMVFYGFLLRSVCQNGSIRKIACASDAFFKFLIGNVR